MSFPFSDFRLHHRKWVLSGKCSSSPFCNIRGHNLWKCSFLESRTRKGLLLGNNNSDGFCTFGLLWNILGLCKDDYVGCFRGIHSHFHSDISLFSSWLSFPDPWEPLPELSRFRVSLLLRLWGLLVSQEFPAFRQGLFARAGYHIANQLNQSAEPSFQLLFFGSLGFWPKNQRTKATCRLWPKILKFW
jgi:hypothetical protein